MVVLAADARIYTSKYLQLKHNKETAKKRDRRNTDFSTRIWWIHGDCKDQNLSELAQTNDREDRRQSRDLTVTRN